MAWQNKNSMPSTGSGLGYTNTSYKDKMQQMSNQERLIEEKKRQIQEKLKAAQQKQTDTSTPPPLKFGIGKRPGFKPSSFLNKKQKIDSKDKAPESASFMANDGNFMERFKQLQGAKLGSTTKSSTSATETSSTGTTSVQVKSEPILSTKASDAEPTFSKNSVTSPRNTTFSQNYTPKSEDKTLQVAAGTISSDVSNSKQGPFNVQQTSSSANNLQSPPVGDLNRFSPQFSTRTDSHGQETLPPHMRPGGQQPPQRFPPPPPPPRHTLPQGQSQDQFYPSNPGIQRPPHHMHPHSPGSFVPHPPPGMPQMLQQIRPSDDQRGSAPYGPGHLQQQQVPPLHQHPSHYVEPPLHNNPRPPPPALMSLQVNHGSYRPQVPPRPPQGNVPQIRPPVTLPMPHQQTSAYPRPPPPPPSMSPGPSSPENSQFEYDDYGKPVRKNVRDDQQYGGPHHQDDQSMYDDYGNPIRRKVKEEFKYREPQRSDDQLMYDDYGNPIKRKVKEEFKYGEPQGSDDQLLYDDYGNPIKRKIKEEFKYGEPHESDHRFDDYGNLIKKSQVKMPLKEEDSDSDYDPAMPTEAESPDKLSAKIKMESFDENIPIKREPNAEKPKLITGISTVVKTKKPLTSPEIIATSSKVKMSEVFDIPEIEVKKEKADDAETREVIDTLASFIAKGGTELEEKAVRENRDNPAFWFLYDQTSHAYKYFRFKIGELTKSTQTEDGNEADTEDQGGEKILRTKKKKKSRWGPEEQEQPPIPIPVLPAVVPNIQFGGAVVPQPMPQPHPMSMHQSHPPQVTLQDFARKMVGSDTLNDDQIQQIKEQQELNMMYELILAQKKAKEAALMAELPGVKPKVKYEYDSDEETEGGTWEHKNRTMEMEATKEWADQITEMNRGKHFIGDFLPPDELERFMETYKSSIKDLPLREELPQAHPHKGQLDVQRTPTEHLLEVCPPIEQPELQWYPAEQLQKLQPPTDCAFPLQNPTDLPSALTEDQPQAEQLPEVQCLTEQLQVQQTPAEQLPEVQCLTEQLQVQQTPAEQLPEVQCLTEQLQVQQTPAEELPEAQSSIRQSQVHQSPPQQLSEVHPSPVQTPKELSTVEICALKQPSLQKYFEDQREKQKCYSIHCNKDIEKVSAQTKKGEVRTLTATIYQRRQKDRERKQQRREDSNYRENEKAKDTLARRKKREDNEYKETEQRKNTEYRKNKRKESEYKQTEQKKNTEYRKRKREDSEYRKSEQDVDTSARKKKRKDSEYKLTEQRKNTEFRRTKRDDSEYKEAEQRKNTEFRRTKRDDTEYNEIEQRKNTEYRKKKREDSEYRKSEQDVDTSARKKKRKDSEYRKSEQDMDTSARKKKRKDSEYRKSEQDMDTSARKKKRKDSEYKLTEQRKNTEFRRTKRDDSEYKEAEQRKNTEFRRTKRDDTEYNEIEQRKNTEYRKKKREDSEYRKSEQDMDTSARKKKRKDSEYKLTEQRKNTEFRRTKRDDSEYKEAEQRKNTEFRRTKRDDTEYKEREQRKNTEYRKKKREDSEYRSRENLNKEKRQKSKRPPNPEAMILHFQDHIKEGPVYICSCCHQLHYKHSVLKRNTAFSRTNSTHAVEDIIQKCLTGLKSVSEAEWLCRTCFSHLKKGKMPPSAVANGMTFPEQGPLQDLNPLELTLLAPMLPFMRIHQAPRGKQHRLLGNMVVVPADIANTVQVLPRMPDNTSTVKAKLKRRLRYKHHVYSLNVRPALIISALRYLSENASLYKTQNIEFSEDYPQMEPTSESETPTDVEEDDDDNEQVDAAVQDHIKTDKDMYDSESDWAEVDEDEMRAGVSDTLLSSPDFVEPSEKDFVYSIAPAEGNKPVSVFAEKHSEELSFPGIFVGQARISNENRSVPVTYSEIVKSELRNKDRRCAKNVENIFFKTKKLQMKRLIDQTNVALRKVTTGGENLTAKDVRGEKMEDIIRFDQGFKALKTLRGSPPYFQAVSKDLFAMIRQLGPATFFCSLSAAETKWLHLLRILGQLVDGKSYTDEELENLTWQDKCRLIQSDPLTCTRHYDYSLQCFLKDIIMSDLNPVGEVTDFFLRIEFQQRGSPHVHMMMWCKNSPAIDIDSDDLLIEYIDSYVTCAIPTNDPELEELVGLQRHRHSHTCKKKGKKKCRFNYPKPPMKRSMILRPLEDIEDKEKTKLKKIWSNIYDKLNEMKDGEDISYEEFLQRIEISEEEYLLAIRSSISTATVFLKRSPLEIRVNSYNEIFLKAWRANIDLQFIIDVYACAMYIASYVTKSQRGISELLRTACKEVRAGNKSLKDQVRVIGNKFLNAVELSAQEACYLAIGLPLKRSSRQTVFINTSPPSERVVLLKPQSQLDLMKEDDENIACHNHISRYSERPKSMENVTLAEYIAYYDTDTTSFTSRSKSSLKKTVDNMLPEQQINDEQQNEDDIDSEIENTETNNTENFPAPLNSTESTPATTSEKVQRRRKKARIIRHVNFNPDTEYEKYCRELLMLYTAWRDEEIDLIANFSSFSEHYMHVKDQIDEIRQKYEPFHQEVHQAEVLLQEDTDQDAWDDVAPNAEHADRQDRREQEDMDTMDGLDPQEQYDIGKDLHPQGARVEDDLNSFHELPDDQFRQHMRTLTKDQIEFVYHIIHHLKTSNEPMYHFLSGGAGVGKSFVTKGLYQMALKFFNRRAGQDFTSSRVILMAPTGKAAYHINGNTIHSTLKLPANQKLQHKALTPSTLNTIQTNLGEVELIFIDEISMVGFKLLNCIHQRLMEIKQSNKPFGGVSIIAVGDLFQLKPVMDSFLFQSPRSDYLPLASNLWQDHFNMTELKEIMRQRESKDFAELLNRLREGKQTQNDINMLNQRLVNPADQDYPFQLPHLFLTNEHVNRHNSAIFLRCSNQKFTVKSKDTILGSHRPDVCEKFLQSFQNKRNDTPQLPTTLELAEGLQYEITINIDTEDGLTNGAFCTLMKVQLAGVQPTYQASGILWVLFPEQHTGAQMRKKRRRLFRQGIEKDWTPIIPVSRQYQAGYKGEAQVQRLQFPLRPSAAKTIHRAQGDTVDNIVVDLTMKRKLDHVHYVALSRVKSIDGLHVLNLQEDKISVSPLVQEEMLRLRSLTTDRSQTFLYQLQNAFKIVFLNANSLRRHLIDVEADHSLQCADILAFCETRFISRDRDEDTLIQGFARPYRQDAVCKPNLQTRPFYGLALYHKPDLNPSTVNSTRSSVEIALLQLDCKVPHLHLVFLYKPPRTPLSTLIEDIAFLHHTKLEEKTVIYMGDFNVDMSSDTSNKKKLCEFFAGLGCRQLIIGPTTDDRTTIDLAFTNIIADIQFGTLEVYYSPHKAIWIAL